MTILPSYTVLILGDETVRSLIRYKVVTILPWSKSQSTAGAGKLRQLVSKGLGPPVRRLIMRSPASTLADVRVGTIYGAESGLLRAVGISG